MMKKFLATTLAIVLTMGMSLTAFAAEGGTGEGAQTSANETQITMDYVRVGGEDAKSPEEAFEFTPLEFVKVEHARTEIMEKLKADPTQAPKVEIKAVSFAKSAADESEATFEVVDIKWPAFEGVGVYTYKFSEVESTTAGVTSAHTEPMHLIVTVEQHDGKYEVAKVNIRNVSDAGNEAAKVKNFEKTYTAGTLTVTKKVAGAMGDTSEKFKATVTFTAPEGKEINSDIVYTVGGDTATEFTTTVNDNGTVTEELVLEHNIPVTFTNIPAGVTYVVDEADYREVGYTTTYTDAEGVVSDDDAESVTGEITGSENDSVVITNKKGGDIDTGIITDNMPYVVLLAIAFVGMVVFFMKKRSAVR